MNLIKKGMGLEQIERTVAMLDEFYELGRFDLSKIKSEKVLVEGYAPAAIYSYLVSPGFSVWIAVGWFPSGDPEIGAEPMVYGEIAMIEVPNDWQVILGLLGMNHRGPGYTKLALLDEGNLIGIDIVLALNDLEAPAVARVLRHFLFSAESTFNILTSRFGNLEPIATTWARRRGGPGPH